MTRFAALRFALLLVAALLAAGCASRCELLRGSTRALAALEGEADEAKHALGTLLRSLPTLTEGDELRPAALQAMLRSAGGAERLLQGLEAKLAGALRALRNYGDSLREEAAKTPSEDVRRTMSERVSALEASAMNLSTQSRATQGAALGILTGVRDLNAMLSDAATEDVRRRATASLGKLQLEGRGVLASFDGLSRIVDQVTALLRR